MSTSTEFRVARLTDREIYDKTHEALADEKVNSIQCTLLFGNSIDGAPDNSELEGILAERTIGIERFVFNCSEGLKVNVRRPLVSGTRNLEGFQDVVSISVTTPDRSAIAVLKKLREAFKPLDQRDFLDYVQEQDRSFYQARESSIRDLQKMQEAFFEKLQDFTVAQASEHQARLKELETKYADKDQLLEKRHLEKLAVCEGKEAELNELKQKLDDRQNTHVRRDLLKEMQKILKERTDHFELTKETQKLRLPPFVGFTTILLLLVSATIFFIYRDYVTTNASAINGWLIGRQIVFGIAFVSMAGFFLKWLSDWGNRHAEEEFLLKRLELDIIRASWVVEHSLEWVNSDRGEIPGDLVKTLSRNLFVQESVETGPHTAAQLLAEALLGNAVSAKLRVGDNEIALDRKGLNNLKKQSVEN